jgi:AcrR family transcriptional regulator
MAYKKSSVTKQNIIEAAIKLFNEKGYYDTNIKEIAAEAGIAHPCIYYYFESKESLAREIFDNIADKIRSVTAKIYEENRDLLLNIMINYILIFRYIAFNKTTQAVYLDLVRYCNYDKSNFNRLKNTYFKAFKDFFAEYNVEATDQQINAYILTSDACAKALFKGMVNCLLDFSLEEAADYFFRHMLICNIKISEEVYIEKLKEAFRICDDINLQ